MVIGSGATAVSLIPTLAEEAAHLTMRQRTPSYMISAVNEELTAKVDPSLPHRARRAYAKLRRGEWSKVDYAATPKGRAISIRTVVRPQPDYKEYAKVLIDVAKERQLEDKA